VLDDARLKNPGKGAITSTSLHAAYKTFAPASGAFTKRSRHLRNQRDYDPSHVLTQTFFATVQNKVHYAIHGQTAAELIATRADSSQRIWADNMGGRANS